jgi:hypothetical protein
MPSAKALGYCHHSILELDAIHVGKSRRDKRKPTRSITAICYLLPSLPGLSHDLDH